MKEKTKKNMSERKREKLVEKIRGKKKNSKYLKLFIVKNNKKIKMLFIMLLKNYAIILKHFFIVNNCCGFPLGFSSEIATLFLSYFA